MYFRFCVLPVNNHEHHPSRPSCGDDRLGEFGPIWRLICLELKAHLQFRVVVTILSLSAESVAGAGVRARAATFAALSRAVDPSPQRKTTKLRVKEFLREQRLRHATAKPWTKAWVRWLLPLILILRVSCQVLCNEFLCQSLRHTKINEPCFLPEVYFQLSLATAQ